MATFRSPAGTRWFPARVLSGPVTPRTYDASFVGRGRARARRNASEALRRVGVPGGEQVADRFRPGLAGGGAVEEDDVPGPTPCTRCGAPLAETDGPRGCALCGQFHEAGSTGRRPTFGAGGASSGGVPPRATPVAPARSTRTSGCDATIFALLAGEDRLGDTGEGAVTGVSSIRTDSPTSLSVRIDTVRDGLALVDAGGVLQVVDLATGEVGVAWGR
jgi:hypothetical protein